jgi:hypothetical protein
VGWLTRGHQEDYPQLPITPPPDQLARNEYVDRIRRIQLNDLENLPFFLIAGFLFILTEPPIALAQWIRGFAAAAFRGLLHGKDSRYPRDTLWTVGSLILIYELLDAPCCFASMTRQQSARSRNSRLRMQLTVRSCNRNWCVEPTVKDPKRSICPSVEYSSEVACRGKTHGCRNGNGSSETDGCYSTSLRAVAAGRRAIRQG